MDQRIGDLPKLLPGGRGAIEAGWKSENVMTITVRVMGQVIDCTATNTPGVLVIDFTLPPGMGFIAPMVEAVIRRAGDKLLSEAKG
jgi:hypothetical protein